MIKNNIIRIVAACAIAPCVMVAAPAPTKLVNGLSVSNGLTVASGSLTVLGTGATTFTGPVSASSFTNNGLVSLVSTNDGVAALRIVSSSADTRWKIGADNIEGYESDAETISISMTGDIETVGTIKSPYALLHAPATCLSRPDFAVAYSDFATNNNFTFLAPAGIDANVYQSCVVLVTNSTAVAKTIAAPANCHISGTAYVTNVTVCSFFSNHGLWTNLICYPLW